MSDTLGVSIPAGTFVAETLLPISTGSITFEITDASDRNINIRCGSSVAQVCGVPVSFPIRNGGYVLDDGSIGVITIPNPATSLPTNYRLRLTLQDYSSGKTFVFRNVLPTDDGTGQWNLKSANLNPDMATVLVDLRTGDSAYQVAQKNGYAGTQAQWLASLVGPTGATGSVTSTPGPIRTTGDSVYAALTVKANDANAYPGALTDPLVEGFVLSDFYSYGFGYFPGLASIVAARRSGTLAVPGDGVHTRAFRTDPGKTQASLSHIEVLSPDYYDLFQGIFRVERSTGKVYAGTRDLTTPSVPVILDFPAGGGTKYIAHNQGTMTPSFHAQRVAGANVVPLTQVVDVNHISVTVPAAEKVNAIFLPTAATASTQAAECASLPFENKWAMTENTGTTFADSVGGTAMTHTATTSTNGVTTFNGTSDYGQFSAPPALQSLSNPWTITARVALTKNQYGVLLGGWIDYGLSIYTNGDGQLRVSIINGGAIQLRFPGTPLADGAEHSVIVTYDGTGAYTSFKAYVDGKSYGFLVDQNNLGALPDMHHSITVMAGAVSNNTYQGYVAGTMRNLNILSMVLSRAQVSDYVTGGN